MREFECAYLVDALRGINGNIAHASAASGKPRRVFFELMRKYDIKASRCTGPADDRDLPVLKISDELRHA